MAEIIELFPGPAPLGHYVRIGSTGHRELERLLESGRLTVDRAVFDAGLVPRQQHLLEALRKRGCETVLDPNVAELSSIGRFDGILSQAPWSVSGRPLRQSDFEGVKGLERISEIARFAVKHQFQAVLAPTHFVDNFTGRLARIDAEMTEWLRSALDAEGGREISIDYQVITSKDTLRDANSLQQHIHSLPIESVWLRISGFGSAATPLGVVRYIEALRGLRGLNRPVVADAAAGLAGLAVLAFGAASAVAHGISVHESFDASSWRRPRNKDAKGGQRVRVLVPAIDRHLDKQQLEYVAATSAGRRLISCNNRHCCPKGFDDMLDDSRAHYLFQCRTGIDGLSKVHQPRRGDHLVHQTIAAARRQSRLLAKLRLTNPKLREVLENSSKRVQRLHEILDHFQAEDAFIDYAIPIADRRSPRGSSRGLFA